MNRREFLARCAGTAAALAVVPVAAKPFIKEPVLDLTGWEFIQDPLPIRFVMEGGAWRKVDTLLELRTGMAINPAWRNAPCELRLYRHPGCAEPPEFRAVVELRNGDLFPTNQPIRFDFHGSQSNP